MQQRRNDAEDIKGDGKAYAEEQAEQEVLNRFLHHLMFMSERCQASPRRLHR